MASFIFLLLFCGKKKPIVKNLGQQNCANEFRTSWDTEAAWVNVHEVGDSGINVRV